MTEPVDNAVEKNSIRSDSLNPMALWVKFDIMSVSESSLGEMLRSISFDGNGTGCYETFGVRPDAKEMTSDQAWDFLANYGTAPDEEDRNLITPRAFSYNLGTKARVSFGWWWDGDGTLLFRVRDTTNNKKERVVVNHDCKKDYAWEQVRP